MWEDLIMVKRILSLLIAIVISLSLIACGGKKHPSNLVGTYYTAKNSYGEIVQLFESGKFHHRAGAGNDYGEWWVENQVLYIQVYSMTSKYDLRIAQQDIDYELENQFKDLSVSEKSEMKLNFKFRYFNTMYFTRY